MIHPQRPAHLAPGSRLAPGKGPRDGSTLSRRAALKLLALGSGGVAASLLMPPAVALGDLEQTESQLADAQAKLDATYRELDAIARDYEELSRKQSDTLDQIELTSNDLAATQQQISDKQQEIEQGQERLGKRVSAAYKSGPLGWIDLLFSATSFEEFTSGIYYLDKVTQSERNLIDGIKDAKAELETLERELTKRAAELEKLSATQKAQLAEMQASQARVQEVIDGLDADVRALMVQRDAELEAARQEAERAAAERAAAEAAAAEAAAAAAARESAAASAASGVTGTPVDTPAGGAASAVISSCYSTPSPGAGLCAGWVTQVFANAGIGWWGGNANDQYNSWCYSSDRGSLQPGMIIAVSSHPHTSAGRIYGHVGVYVGGGMVMDNIGYIRSCSVDYWCDFYGQTVTPRWGWFGGVVLS